MTDVNSFHGEDAWFQLMDAEFGNAEEAIAVTELPVARRRDFLYGLNVFEGEELRGSLNAVVVEALSRRVSLESAADLERFKLETSQAMNLRLEARRSGVVSGSIVALKGPGSVLTRKNPESDELEPLPLLPSHVLFGSLGGVACGVYRYTEGTDLAELVDPVRVAQLSEVIGGLLYLECIHICSQADGQQGKVVRADLDDVFVPLAVTDLPIYNAHPLG